MANYGLKLYIEIKKLSIGHIFDENSNKLHLKMNIVSITIPLLFWYKGIFDFLYAINIIENYNLLNKYIWDFIQFGASELIPTFIILSLVQANNKEWMEH